MKTKYLLPLIVAIIVGVVGLTAQSQKSPPPRLAWEFKIVAFTAGNPPLGFNSELYVDGKLISKSETSALPKLKELGDDGWELVTVLQNLNENNHWFLKYYFKRAK